MALPHSNPTGAFVRRDRKHSLASLLLLLGSAWAMPAAAQVQFSDVAPAAGLANDTYVSSNGHGLGANWIDYDRDGWPDLFAVNGPGAGGAHLYRNEGNGSFSAQDQLLPALPDVQMMGSVFADIDNDGDSDIYIFTDNSGGAVGPSAGPQNILLENQWVENGNQVMPGQPLFVDITVAAQVQDLLDTPNSDGPGFRAATGGFLDYDRDGNVDLYACHWDRGNHGTDTTEDRLYRNMGTGVFSDVTDSTGIIPVADGTYQRSCLAFIGAHLDSDLWPDIYIGNVDAPLPHSGDIIFQNNGGTGFIDRTADSPGVGDDAGAAMGVTVGDVDMNGGLEIYISDLGGGVAPVGNPIYFHTGSDIIYSDNTANTAGVVASGSWGVNFLDVDHDGYEDLFVGTMAFDKTNILYINNDGDGTFTELPGGLGINLARGSAYADYDRDGDLDIAVVGLDDTIQLHRNDSQGIGHWLQVELRSNLSGVGMQSNGDAIGTMVKATIGGMMHSRQVIGGDSGHGQNSTSLHFGLGAQTSASQLDVFWPSGATATLTNVPADTFIAVHENGAAAALVSPAAGSTISSATTTFDWMSAGVTGIDGWQLLVGSAPGMSDMFDSGALAGAINTVDATGLPTDGTQVFARLLYDIGGMTHHIDYQFGSDDSGPPPPPPPPPPPGDDPGITSPVPDTTLAGSTETFVWSANDTDVTKWQLQLGTSPGGRDLYSKNFAASETSHTVNGLPTDGSTVYVRLRWKADGAVNLADYTYTAAGDGEPPPPPPPPPPPGDSPEMTSPVDGSELTGSTQLFSWTANGTDVTKWQIWIGTAPGTRDLQSKGLAADTTSYTVNNLPTDGSSIYVRLRWKSGGTVSFADYVYTAAGGT